MIPPSVFADRFEFARIHQAHSGLSETDGRFAKAIGVVPASITDYKSREDPPPPDRVLLIAERCGVDPGWLAFGEKSTAVAPPGFAAWYAKQDHSPLLPPLAPPDATPDLQKKGRAG